MTNGEPGEEGRGSKNQKKENHPESTASGSGFHSECGTAWRDVGRGKIHGGFTDWWQLGFS